MNKSNDGSLQDQWSSRGAFILAATGAAVGLGNIWRFPYMAGTHGGSAFVLVYLLFVVIMGLPILIAEILIGRRARKNPVDALASLAKIEHQSKQWRWIGWMGLIALLLVLSFYSVVAGWAIAYLGKSVSGTLTHMSATQVTSNWNHFLSSPKQMLLWHSVFMLLTVSVLILGVQKGLERAAKIMMPALYVILFLLVGFAAIHGDFIKAVHYLFDFKLQAITADVVIAAMGHAFFTLALGAGAMLTYGAYMPKNAPIVSSVFIVAALDILVALLSGLAIFPIVFQYHLAPNSGPGLMFVTLPIAFSHMQHGALLGGLFFLLLIFAAWTSSLNLAEPMVITLMSRSKLSRFKATIIVGLCAWLIGIGSLLSFNVLKHVTVFHHFSLFDIATDIPTDIILPIGGLGFALFAGFVMSKKATENEIDSSLYPVWHFLIRYIAPLAILAVFIYSLI